MLTLTFARHGQTDYNVDGRVQGRGIDSDLNETGRWQAGRLAERLAPLSFDAIYTSTQRRTHQTAAPLLAGRAGPAPVALEGLEGLEGLDEMDWGIYEGRAATSEIRAEYARYVEAWTAGDFDREVEGGESPSQVEARARRAIRYIQTAHPSGSVLVVTHGRLLRILLASLLPEYTLHRMQDLTHENTALSVVEIGSDGPRARFLSDASHLDAAQAA